MEEFEAIDNQIVHPEYDYKAEAELVLERLAVTATDPRRKAIVETMDDKISASTMLLINHITSFKPAWEQFVFHEAGNRLIELESTVLSWRQKILFNLVRPTTIEQSQGYMEECVTTYAGPFCGVQETKSRGVQPYIRTMSHGEYPSGSACIFSAWKRFW